MFKLASTALKSRDEDLNEAIEALGDREADQEIKAENKKLKKENRELKRENKEQDKQLKRFQKAKSEGTAVIAQCSWTRDTRDIQISLLNVVFQ